MMYFAFRGKTDIFDMNYKKRLLESQIHPNPSIGQAGLILRLSQTKGFPLIIPRKTVEREAI